MYVTLQHPNSKQDVSLCENSRCVRHSYTNSLSLSVQHQGTCITEWVLYSRDSLSVYILHEHYMHSLISMDLVIFTSIQIALHQNNITCQWSNYWCLLSLQQMISTSQVDNATPQPCYDQLHENVNNTNKHWTHVFAITRSLGYNNYTLYAISEYF
jgi:hypothetical protein